eukprot:6190552-Pleurochrysis_carterae.AAC.3
MVQIEHEEQHVLDIGRSSEVFLRIALRCRQSFRRRISNDKDGISKVKRQHAETYELCKPLMPDVGWRGAEVAFMDRPCGGH